MHISLASLALLTKKIDIVSFSLVPKYLRQCPSRRFWCPYRWMVRVLMSDTPGFEPELNYLLGV